MADKDVEIILKGEFKNGKRLIDATNQIDENVKKIGKDAQKTTKNVSSLEKNLKRLASIVGIGLLVRGFNNLVKSSLNAAGAMEQVDIALTTMLGSAEEAANLQKDLIEFAKRTPFQIEGIFSTTKQLLAYGVAQEDIISTMSNLGNIASGVGVPMERLALVFGQVRSTGRLLGQDLNQFTQAGVPLLAELAKLLGTTEAEVLKLKESGAISFDIVKQALENMTSEGGRFFNLMQNQSKTFLGTVSNMQDSLFQVRNALGNALLPAAKRVVNFMIPAFEKLTQIIIDNEKSITKFAQGFITALSSIGKVIKFVANRVADFVRGIKTLLSLPIIKHLALAAAAFVTITKSATLAAAAIKILSGTMFGWVSVIGAVVTAIGFLSKDVEKLPDTIKIMMLTSSKWFEQLKFVVAQAVSAILDRLSLLSKVPGFGWIEDAQNRFSNMKDNIISNVDEINEAIANIKSPSIIPEAGGSPDAPQDMPAVQQKIETQAPDPAARLEAIKEENQALLAEQKAFLEGTIVNQNEADATMAENEALRREQKLLGEEEFAARKKELDEKFLNDEITLDERRKELQLLSNEAKLEVANEQYEAELEAFQESQTAVNELKNQMQMVQDQTEVQGLQTKLNAETKAKKQTDKKQLKDLQVKLDTALLKQKEQNVKLIQAKVNKDKADTTLTRQKGEWELKFEKALSSDKVKTAKNTADLLVGLSNSKNKSIAAIGKAAAIFNITLDTARGSIAAYQALAPIPIVGPGLGAAAAAAVIAYGAEQMSKVKGSSFAVGTDNVPQDQLATVHKGEIIVPATFSEAIRSGDLSLSGSSDSAISDNNSSSSPIITNININFDGASFIGQIDDDNVEMLGERLGQLISEDIIPAIPTRTA